MLQSIDTCQNRVSADHYQAAMSRAQAHRGHNFFEADRCPIAGLTIGSRAQVRSTCSKQGRIILKPDLSLKFNRIITFSSIKMFAIQD